jgi:hypothetical protein
MLLVLVCLLGSWLYAWKVADCSSDLFPIWNGTQAVLHGHSPYSDTVTQQNLAVLNNGHDENRFAYPLYSAFLFTPLALMPYSATKVLASILFTCLAALGLYWWGFRSWQLLLAMAAWPLAYAIQIQQVTLVFFALLGAAVYCVKRSQFGTAGFLLALSTAKPQLAIAVCLSLLLLSSWPLIRSFAVTLGCLLAASFVLQPHWFAEWLGTLAAYSHYAVPSLPVALFGSTGNVVRLLALIFGAVAFFLVRDLDSRLAVSITTFALVLPFQLYNEVILIPVVLWLWKQHDLLPGFARAASVFLLALMPLLTTACLLFPALRPILGSVAVTFALIAAFAVYLGTVGVLLNGYRAAAKSGTRPANLCPGATRNL